MKRLAHERATSGVASSSRTAPVIATRTFPHDNLITQKPLYKRSDWLGYDNPRFIGFESRGDPLTSSIVEHTCDVGYTFATSGSFYGCCATTTSTCSFAITCIGDSVEYEGGYQLFEGGVISRCAGYCLTAALFRSVDDNAPLTHIGCSADYIALRTPNADDVDGWYAPTSLSPGPSIPYTSTRPLGLTPTPGEVLVSTDNEGIVESGVILSWHVKLTKVSGGIIGGVILLLLISCCILGKRKRNRERRKRSVRNRTSPLGVVYPVHPAVSPRNQSYFSWNRSPQEDGIISRQDHELEAVPEGPLETRGDGAPPAYQVFQQGLQRAGYEAL